jgi:hypothetical protein
MRIAFLLSLVLLTLAGPVAASPSGFGLQLGASTDLYFGIHYLLPISHRLVLAPSVDLSPAGGVGGLTLNGSLLCNLLPAKEIIPYVGAGISSFSAGPSSDTSDVPDEAGPVLIAGVWLNRHGGTAYSLESRFGLSGMPVLTMMLAITF